MTDTNRVDLFHLLMKIVKSYPIAVEEPGKVDGEEIRKPVKANQLPEIIISKSFA